ncbi:MAG: GNAT family protein [Chloroflexota bacterium]
MPPFDFTSVPTLKTERLVLRRIVATDEPIWSDILANPDVRRYLSDFNPNTPEEHAAEMREIMTWSDTQILAKTGVRWAITHSPDDTMIGSCGFHAYNPDNNHAEIGYELHPDYWRKGIMREAVTAVINFCFDELQVHRIEADVTVGNVASKGLLESLGFMHEGTWRERVATSTGDYASLWFFGLLKREWQSV